MADKFIKAENPSTASVPNLQMGSTLGGVTKLQSTNSATNRTLTLPDKDGVIATLADAQGNNSALLSAGCIDIPTFTDNGNGSATIGTGSYNIFNNTDGAGGLAAYTNVAGGTFTFVDGVNNYVVANYNNGSPILQSITNNALINETTIVPIYTVFRTGTDLDWLNWDKLGYALPNKIHQSIVKTQRFRRQDGLGLGEIATRIVSISAGTVWVGATPVSLSAFNSGVDTMVQAYHSAGTWTYLTTTTYNNTQYDDGTNLQTLTATRYAVNFIYYIVQDEANKVVFVLGNNDATLAEATVMQPPATLPPEISSAGILVGRIIIQKSATSATQIDSAFNQFWGSGSGGGGGVSDHNSLNGLQGGQASEYYHLTSASYAFCNALDQSVATTASPTFSTALISAGGSGKTTLTRASSATNYTITLPASTGTLVVDTALANYALKAGDTIGSVVLGDGTQQASLSVSATNGLVARAKTGSANDWALLNPAGSTTLIANPTGTNTLTSGAAWSFTNATASTSIGTGCAVFYGGVGIAGDAWIGGSVNANNIKVSAGGAGQTTITRDSSATSYTATLPAKTGTFAFLDDISGGQNVLVNGATVSSGATGVIAVPISTAPMTGVANTLQLFVAPALGTATPQMTSNTAPSGVASASSISSGDTDSYWAFNSTATYGWLSGPAGVPGWIQYQFPTAKMIKAYAIVPYSYNAVEGRKWLAWTLQGSSNGSTWTDLDTRTSTADLWAANTERLFNVANPGTYLYYRLTCTLLNGDVYVGCKSLRLLADVSGTSELYYRGADGSLNLVGKLTFS